MAEALLEAVRGLRVADPGLGVPAMRVRLGPAQQSVSLRIAIEVLVIAAQRLLELHPAEHAVVVLVALPSGRRSRHAATKGSQGRGALRTSRKISSDSSFVRASTPINIFFAMSSVMASKNSSRTMKPSAQRTVTPSRERCQAFHGALFVSLVSQCGASIHGLGVCG